MDRSCREQAVGWRAVHDQAPDRAQPIHLAPTRGPRYASCVASSPALAFFDLCQGTTRDPSRCLGRNANGGCDVLLRQDPDRACAVNGNARRRVCANRRQAGCPSPPRRNRQASRRRVAELLKPEQLEALVAPVALYPDELLANVLAASTYPLEVVQADRWLKSASTSRAMR